ncbi:nucleotide exchange factor GrpE [Candidatus Roizmanbacteria bacterium]|nr:nucleotide exchange factor GrpE [Candidatus Roizmanbacteria bacterium]
MTDKDQNKQAKSVQNDEVKKLQDELEQFKSALEEEKKKTEENKTKYLRALADYQNFENRVASQREELINNANKHLIIKLLSFLDNLDQAEIFVKDNHLKLIKDSFHKMLKEEGLKELEVKGKEYDPYTAEVIDMVEGEKANQVVDVLRKGYEMNGKVIRVAQVKVSKKL